MPTTKHDKISDISDIPSQLAEPIQGLSGTLSDPKITVPVDPKKKLEDKKVCQINAAKSEIKKLHHFTNVNLKIMQSQACAVKTKFPIFPCSPLSHSLHS